LGLALSEKQIPQVVVNVANSKHGMERIEWLNVLAKQVSNFRTYLKPSLVSEGSFIASTPHAEISLSLLNRIGS
jgi:hypothetical protein